MWTATLIVGGAAVFQVLFGRVRIITGDGLKNLLGLMHWALLGIAAASVGAWLAVSVMSRGRDWRRLARDAVIVVGIIVATAVVARFAERRPSRLMHFTPPARASQTTPAFRAR